ncbi:hypothetical protein INT43_004164 [Umbelopsis isabellina]|uniref:Uncharacterized protein n=1 Tax=Mortierella isabellina TaxID=91625 RepID=A0A8H7UC50_MORIS|nr:hypothetical protein INT43_004164 [Umbelopsis isabellina]
MENVIELINKVQDVFSTIGGNDSLDLPQIISVGSQSSGKSSVIENIVQRDFLPRGSGVVTRRPLVLQLVTLASSEDQEQPQEYAEFLHIPNKRFYDFSEVRKEIEDDTARIAGSNKGISRQPIHLKIYSPKVLNLTMVDLPGLTKIPIGDQPTDIEKQTRNLIVDYISKPNSIILAVTPANADLVNSDSLKLARQVDPEGKRTIGVLTKLDLMDAGTNALDTLTGRAYPLKLGFIGLVNRSQQDILTNKPMSDAIRSEKDFFLNHPSYRSIAHRCGTAYLSKQLNNILMNHIRDKLPDIRSKLSTMIGQTQHELAQYGDMGLSSKLHRGSLVLQLLTKFANDFVASIDGTLSDISTKELCGGARIYFIFNNVFGQALESIAPCANLTDHDIKTAIRNSTGPRPSLFVPEIAFDLLVKPQISLLEPPSLRCVELVYEELMRICHNCGSKEIQRFPRLYARLVEVVSDLLQERLSPTSSYVESLIAIERAYINTNHSDFLGAAGAMAQLESQNKKHRALERKRAAKMSQINGRIEQTEKETLQVQHTHHDSAHQLGTSPKGDSFLTYFFGGANKHERPALGSMDLAQNSVSPPSISKVVEAEMERQLGEKLSLKEQSEPSQGLQRDELEVKLIRSLITSYFEITRQTIHDLVPKAVMHLLVNYSRESVQNRLVAALYKDELFAELLHEDENLAQEREKCKAMLDLYKKAFTIINDAM